MLNIVYKNSITKLSVLSKIVKNFKVKTNLLPKWFKFTDKIIINKNI
jgi:hypothetical protein